MTIQAYFQQIKSLTDRYAATDFVLDVQMSFDLRPGEQGYLNGSIVFKDGSLLHFREFLDAAEKVVEKVMYTYHYQDSSHQLIFRYDNALHKPPLPNRDHKHVPDKIMETLTPTLAEIMLEIVMLKGWM
jgi:hypothetical protein